MKHRLRILFLALLFSPLLGRAQSADSARYIVTKLNLEVGTLQRIEIAYFELIDSMYKQLRIIMRSDSTVLSEEDRKRFDAKMILFMRSSSESRREEMREMIQLIDELNTILTRKSPVKKE